MSTANPTAALVPVTLTADEPTTVLSDDGVRHRLGRPITDFTGLERVHPGQRLLARMSGSEVITLELPHSPVVVHQQRCD